MPLISSVSRDVGYRAALTTASFKSEFMYYHPFITQFCLHLIDSMSKVSISKPGQATPLLLFCSTLTCMLSSSDLSCSLSILHTCKTIHQDGVCAFTLAIMWTSADLGNAAEIALRLHVFVVRDADDLGVEQHSLTEALIAGKRRLKQRRVPGQHRRSGWKESTGVWRPK